MFVLAEHISLRDRSVIVLVTLSYIGTPHISWPKTCEWDGGERAELQTTENYYSRRQLRFSSCHVNESVGSLQYYVSLRDSSRCTRKRTTSFLCWILTQSINKSAATKTRSLPGAEEEGLRLAVKGGTRRWVGISYTVVVLCIHI